MLLYVGEDYRIEEKACLIEKVEKKQKANLSLLSQLWEVNKKYSKIVNKEVVTIMLFRDMKIRQEGVGTAHLEGVVHEYGYLQPA